MNELVPFLSYLLSSMGLAVLVVWPQDGPAAFLRERFLKKLLPGMFHGMLDCYICFGFWCGLFLTPVWFLFYHQFWCLTGCLEVPFLFWLILSANR